MRYWAEDKGPVKTGDEPSAVEVLFSGDVVHTAASPLVWIPCSWCPCDILPTFMAGWCLAEVRESKLKTSQKRKVLEFFQYGWFLIFKGTKTYVHPSNYFKTKNDRTHGEAVAVSADSSSSGWYWVQTREGPFLLPTPTSSPCAFEVATWALPVSNEMLSGKSI